jgi:hypothetical protein
MKLRATLTVLALACGTAFAAQDYSARDAAASRSPSTAASTETKPAGEGIVDKTKRGVRRMGDKMRGATDRSAHRDPINEQAARKEAQTMGATGTDNQDSARRSRMDEAYDNWKSKQQK